MLKTAGYVVESKISTFDGYYVNGDNTIEIVVAEDKTFKVYFNGKAVTANANWNGTILTLKTCLIMMLQKQAGIQILQS